MHSSTDTTDRKLLAFFQAHPQVVLITGAGVSTAAGLNDYRDKQGQWKQAQPMQGNSFRTNADLHKRYWARSALGWPWFAKALPTPAHHAIAALESTGHITSVITQNVDGLHQKAGQQNLIELHGNLAYVRCLNCQTRFARAAIQQKLLGDNPWLQQQEANRLADGDAQLEDARIQTLTPPVCEKCTGMLQPDVVFYGDSVDQQTVTSAKAEVTAADALVVAGSSLMVWSSYRFCILARDLHIPIAIINDGKTRADDLAQLKVDGDLNERLQRLQKNVAP